MQRATLRTCQYVADCHGDGDEARRTRRVQGDRLAVQVEEVGQAIRQHTVRITCMTSHYTVRITCMISHYTVRITCMTSQCTVHITYMTTQCTHF